MSHNTIDYSKSETPRFDALEDVKDWLGDDYDRVAAIVKLQTNPRVFSICCDFRGMQGYCVKVWYEHFHGQDTWDSAWAQLEENEKQADLQDE